VIEVRGLTDGWIDEVLGLGIWVNSWMGWSGQDGLVEEDSMGLTHTSAFLVSSLCNTQKDQQDDIPQTKDDIRMDE